MEEKVLTSESGLVSVGKVSIIASGEDSRREVRIEVRDEESRARRATARFPCEG